MHGGGDGCGTEEQGLGCGVFAALPLCPTGTVDHVLAFPRWRAIRTAVLVVSPALSDPPMPPCTSFHAPRAPAPAMQGGKPYRV